MHNETVGLHGPDHFNSESVATSGLDQRLHAAASSVPEVEVVPHEQFLSVKYVHQEPLDELIRTNGGEVSRKTLHDRHIDAVFRKGRKTVAESHQEPRRRQRTNDTDWMGIESQDNRRDAARLGVAAELP